MSALPKPNSKLFFQSGKAHEENKKFAIFFFSPSTALDDLLTKRSFAI
jgi:hypothetical protein